MGEAMKMKPRPMTILATEIVYGKSGVEALHAGRCPTCNAEIEGFRDEVSKREFEISGMCQKCQDVVFGEASK